MANQLEMRPKGQLKLCSQPTWNEARYLKFRLEKANLATLVGTSQRSDARAFVR